MIFRLLMPYGSINLNASFLLNGLSSVLSTKSITHLGLVLLCSLNIQPMALLIKNSLEPKRAFMVVLSISVWISPLYFSWNNSAQRCSQMFPESNHLST